ncbi:phytoene/squalene synthase family protein [Azotobacter beijerinckii]|uniref:Farnesyl-diphosphate farnesyltransferase n=1 Tax=Azotobacter beijerinckii TaxID=170623 RepID=A0A1I4FSB8_9GAMM|nr:phytoene/squalene synthase family protein [Azotobacter beijerinckii]SFB53977.1 farnesyl-diphosphate farnesyltransferase [Azotobacter beijerinckii]SFL20724.1 farnesyl-diphosphate farnesyltransferase [Azotobacter beijerinckii]
MLEPQLASVASESGADAYQNAILPKVSRTFALTIPQLPPPLRRAVTNAYLLCRVADTIEDEPAFSAEQKRRYEDAFIDAVTGRIDAQRFSAELAPLFSQRTLEAERDLVSQLPLVLQVTRSLGPAQRMAIVNCLKVMSHGMHDFQRNVGLHGLDTLRDMDCYCYCVAGVVGEMLTELLIDFDPTLASQREPLMRMAISFGQGLQMTNILKDQWEDYSRGVCWLPQDVFTRYGVRLEGLQAGQQDANYAGALTELIGVAHAHLRNALEYTLMIPAKHAGFRRFCLWSIGLAVLTLRKLQKNLDFSAGTQVKVSRRAVTYTIALTRLSGNYNTGLRWLFAATARGLPLTPLSAEWSSSPHTHLIWPKSAISYFAETA